jgi:nucleosome assembly protein 1-like 1
MANNQNGRIIDPNRALSDSDGDDDEDEDEQDPLAHLPEYVLHRVKKLQELNESRKTIMEQYLVERAGLEKRFNEKLQPLYTERASIVRGEHDEAIANEVNVNLNGDCLPRERTEADVGGIPQFWACAMTQMETIGELITEEDVDCLEHVQDVTKIDRDDGKGFTLRFFFAPNDYFTNTVLEKNYEVPNMLLSDEPLLKSVTGTTIDWKPGKCLTHRTVNKKQRGKGKHAGQLRTVSKNEQKESFFHWFSPPEMPPIDSIDEEEAEKLELIFDSDYEVAQAFRTDLIPKAVLWFSGKVSVVSLESC